MNRLYRSRSDRILAGVAAGVAEALRADPALVRVVWVVLVFLTSGLMLLLYIVMAIVVPVRPEPAGGSDAEVADAPEAEHGATAPGNAPVLIGAVLIIIGAYFLVRQYIPAIDFGFIWPVLVIIVGVVLLLGALRRNA